MRRDLKILDVMAKTRRQERETACCIRNDDSGCVQSSQADCSVRGLWPTVCVFLIKSGENVTDLHQQFSLTNDNKYGGKKLIISLL